MLVQWLLNQNIKPVQLGIKKDKLVCDGVYDLRGQTSPREAAHYLKNSLAYVGVEGGLFHMAKATKTPSVVLFASTSISNFSYSDTYSLSSQKCYPCWWTKGWEVGNCSRGKRYCLNSPEVGDVISIIKKNILNI
jgi:ADP-heptose:LPS heptosyltransferase